MLRHAAFACLLMTLAARHSVADVTGQATVIDGDTIVVAGERVRLQGIDAPELQQACTAYGQSWACGRKSAEWLKEHVNGRRVECVGHARDRYGRLLAVCYAGGQSTSGFTGATRRTTCSIQVADTGAAGGLRRPSK